VQYETKWVSERSVWMLRSDVLLRYSFFYSGDNDYRNSSVSFCNAAPLLISDFFSAPLAKQKEKEELEKKYKELFAEKNFGFKRLMKAFPDMTSREQNESLQKYKKYFNIRRNKNDQNS